MYAMNLPGGQSVATVAGGMYAPPPLSTSSERSADGPADPPPPIFARSQASSARSQASSARSQPDSARSQASQSSQPGSSRSNASTTLIHDMDTGSERSEASTMRTNAASSSRSLRSVRSTGRVVVAATSSADAAAASGLAPLRSKMSTGSTASSGGATGPGGPQQPGSAKSAKSGRDLEAARRAAANTYQPPEQMPELRPVPEQERGKPSNSRAVIEPLEPSADTQSPNVAKMASRFDTWGSMPKERRRS